MAGAFGVSNRRRQQLRSTDNGVTVAWNAGREPARHQRSGLQRRPGETLATNIHDYCGLGAGIARASEQPEKRRAKLESGAELRHQQRQCDHRQAGQQPVSAAVVNRPGERW